MVPPPTRGTARTGAGPPTWNTVGDPDADGPGAIEIAGVADGLADTVVAVAVALAALVGAGVGLALAAGAGDGSNANSATAPIDATRTPDSSPRTIESRGPTRRG
jgi:hypothetical protein